MNVMGVQGLGKNNVGHGDDGKRDMVKWKKKRVKVCPTWGGGKEGKIEVPSMEEKGGGEMGQDYASDGKEYKPGEGAPRKIRKYARLYAEVGKPWGQNITNEKGRKGVLTSRPNEGKRHPGSHPSSLSTKRNTGKTSSKENSSEKKGGKKKKKIESVFKQGRMASHTTSSG